MTVSWREKIRVASGHGVADLLIRNGRVINVFTGEIEQRDVAIHGGTILGSGDYRARRIIDLDGLFLCPGLIDGHVHIESSMVTLPEYARAVLPHGTTSVVIDPHEIANVLGEKGVRFMAESARGIPLNVLVMVPSCVPATHLETSGAILRAGDIARLLKQPWAGGLGEMMNFPGVIARDPGVLKKIEAARGMRIDGHAPHLSGKGLNAYLVAGMRSDHECTLLTEAKEKVRRGMRIMIREGTAARNLSDLLPLVTPENSRRFFFVTDDRHPKELIEEGHIDSILRKAISLGLNPVQAIQMATLNAAEYFRLDDLGAIAPGYRADLVSFDHLSTFRVKKVFKDGILVADEGRLLPGLSRHFPGLAQSKRVRPPGTGKLHIGRISVEDLILHSDTALAKVIQLIPDQIVTKKIFKRVLLKDGVAYPNTEEDILKLLVVERHRGTGNLGIGFVQGFGLKKGALGSSVAHDSHNLVVVGTNDQDIFSAIQSLAAMGGGLVAVSDDRVLASVPLPVAGLMAEKPVNRVHQDLETLLRKTRALGCRLPDPFMTLSFLSLAVIPELKLTDRGLVDVTQFKFVPLFGEG